MLRDVPAARAARGKLPINVVGCLCRNRKEDGLVKRQGPVAEELHGGNVRIETLCI